MENANVLAAWSLKIMNGKYNVSYMGREMDAFRAMLKLKFNVDGMMIRISFI